LLAERAIAGRAYLVDGGMTLYAGFEAGG